MIDGDSPAHLPQDRSDANDDAKALAASAESCTRSGVFALVMSLAIASLAFTWRPHPDGDAFGRYAKARLMLSLNLAQLNNSAAWRCYVASNPSAESESIEALLDVRANAFCDSRNADNLSSNFLTEPRTPASDFIVVRGQPQRPPAPTGVRVLGGGGGAGSILEVTSIYEQLTVLDEPDLLERSRRVSAYQDFVIYGWMMKRNSLWQGSSNAKPKRPLRYDQQYLASLRLRDIRTLSESELPRLVDFTKLSGENEPYKVSIVPGSLPGDRDLAGIIATLLLLFVVVYFAVFASDAMSYEAFPGSGTLFGAFLRSYVSTACFVVALLIPPLAAGVLAIVSKSWLIGILNIVIGVAIASVLLGLWRKRRGRPHEMLQN